MYPTCTGTGEIPLFPFVYKKERERERERTIGCDEVTLSVLFKPIIDLNYNLKGHT